MRLARIEIGRYGHLADIAIDLPAHAPDLHLLVGANEAGKSTTQAALADLLFGFGHRTDYAFRYPERDLRLGAVVESGTSRLTAWRRKGRKDTLRDADDRPIEEAALSRMLAGISRDDFLGQFSLNHERLRAGGQAILAEKDDLGRLLFQAGAGLDRLTERLRRLDLEAGELFAPRASSKAVARGLQRREQARKAMRDAAGSASAFQEAQRALGKATAALDEQRRHLAALRKERERLNRAQRVIPALRVLDALAADITKIGEVPRLPPEFRATLTRAAQGQTEAQRRVAVAQEELAKARDKLGEATVEDAVLARADDIAPLADQIGAIRKADSDLPRRQGELDGLDETIARLLGELGRGDLAPETVASHVPTRETAGRLRRLVEEHGRLGQALDTAREAEAVASRAADRAEEVLAGLPLPADTALLRAALAAAERATGLTERLRRSAEDCARLRDAIVAKRAALVPALPEGLARAALPSAATVQDFEAELAAIDARLEERRRDRDRVEAELAERRAESRALVAAGTAVPPERLNEARERRDRGWRLVRQAHIDGGTADGAAVAEFAGGQLLAEAFEAAMAAADHVADLRFAAAEASARLAESAVAAATLEARRSDLVQRIAEDVSRRARLMERWHGVWPGLTPESPEAMVRWLERLEEIEGLSRDLAATEDLAAALGTAKAGLCRQLAEALAALDSAPAVADDLDELLRLGRECEVVQRERALARSQAAKSLTEKHEAAKAAAAKRADAGRAFDRWRAGWAETMADFNRPPEADPADQPAFLAIWDEIREADAKARSLRHRIAAITADRQAFAERTGALAAELSLDLSGQSVLDVARALVARLAEVRAAAQRRAERQDEVTARQADLDGAQAEEHDRTAEIGDLLGSARARSLDEAWPVVERTEERNRLCEQIRKAEAVLAEAGEGRSQDALRAECGGYDADALPGKVAELTEREQTLIAEVEALSAESGAAQQTLNAFHRAGSAAAEAAEDAAQATTDVVRAAERWIRVQATAVVLRHAIERYRKENEAPLLGRAGALFRALTLGRYGRLAVEHDSGSPQLLAIEAAAERSVPVEGLSDGARDQLFLALRLAAVERALESGIVLPFIADDLFVNFDDDRAAAGLAVLAGLAARTQVLLFTHHRHLAELAERRIAGSFQRTSLGV